VGFYHKKAPPIWGPIGGRKKKRKMAFEKVFKWANFKDKSLIIMRRRRHSLNFLILKKLIH
jgi:hypothetical protein